MIKKDTLATFRVEDDLWEQFKAKATEERFSASELLHQFVEGYVSGKVPSPLLDKTTGDLNRRIDERIENLDKRIDDLEECIDKRIDTVKAELETALQKVRGSIILGSPKAEDKPRKKRNPVKTARPTEKEPPINTQELCKRLGRNYSNLAKRAKNCNRTSEGQLAAEALEQGQEWRVCKRKGQSPLWERVR